MRVISSVIIAFVMVLLLGVSANAQTEIYGIGSFDGRLDPCCPPCDGPVCEVCICDDTFDTNQIIGFLGESAFYQVNPINGNPIFIGYTGFAGCRGLDIHPTTGDFYAVCNRFEIHGPPGPPGMNKELDTNEEEIGQVLVHIDPNTGQGTEIGPLGDGIGAIFSRSGFISDISFDSTGELYAHLNTLNVVYVPLPADPAEKTSSGVTDNTLGTIDLLTGTFQPVGPTGSKDFISAIGFSNIGELIQCANFNNFDRRLVEQENNIILDPSFTNINSLNINTGLATFIEQAAFPPDVAGHFNVITSKDADDSTGVFYAFLNTEFDNWIFDADTKNIDNGTYLVRINPSNGNVDIIGQTSLAFETFAAIAVRSNIRDVPTMSEYGLMATAVLLLGAATLYLRRRKAQTEV